MRVDGWPKRLGVYGQLRCLRMLTIEGSHRGLTAVNTLCQILTNCLIDRMILGLIAQIIERFVYTIRYWHSLVGKITRGWL
jgi:hypothetical protein